MPVKKLVKKIKSAVSRRRRPGVVSKTKGSTGVTNSTRRKYRTSNMTEKGVDRTKKPKASVTKDFKRGKSLGYKEKKVSLDRDKGRGTITKTRKNITTGKKKTSTKSVSAAKARRVLKRMDRKTDRMINRAARKTARQKRRSKR